MENSVDSILQQHPELAMGSNGVMPQLQHLAANSGEHPSMLAGLHTLPLQSMMAAAEVPAIEMKLFVGRIPRNATEEQLRPIFEEFGQVLEVAIIKDKITGQHKGAAFVRMASITQADSTIRALNNIRILEPSLGPMQVRYATGEAEKLGLNVESGVPGQDQAKLFVGSLPKTVLEEEVRAVFAPYGNIDEVYLLKDNINGTCKGCAFVKFAFKEHALNAIRALNGQFTFPGGPRPLEVRFAENKRQQQVGGSSAVGVAGMRMALGGTSSPVGMGAAVQPPSNLNPRQAGPWKEYFTQDSRPYYHNEISGQTQWERPAEFEQLSAAVSGRSDVTGPPGANIFVFHIPNDWSQADLVQNFNHFGTIVSAHIATDKATGRNKGYAFVSFDNVNSAVAAVSCMNGFLAGGKRLKVSIKQHEDKYVAHLLPQTGSPSPLTSMSLGLVPGLGVASNSLQGVPQPMAMQSMMQAPQATQPSAAPVAAGIPPATFAAYGAAYGATSGQQSHRFGPY